MALSIRLQRHGKTHRPFYHIVAAERKKARNGRFIEKLGYYDPHSEPSTFVCNEDRVKYWYSKGAIISTCISKILQKKKVTLVREKHDHKKSGKTS